MDSEELRDTLQEAGLSPYQSKAYVALLELGAASAQDLVAASDVPGARIYDVVRSLKDRGYVETYEQDTLQVRAHDPSEVLEDLTARATQLEAAADEIEERWEQPELEHHAASIVKRVETVVDRARLFIEGARNQVQLSASPAQFAALEGALADAVDRGVYVQVSLYTRDGDASELPDERVLARTTTEARHRRLPSPFIALVDRQQACFAPQEGVREEYGVLVDDRAHEYVFHWYFVGCLWEVCEEIYDGRSDEPPIEYVDVREFIRDVEPWLDAGETVTVRVEGWALSNGADRLFEGDVVDAFTDRAEQESAVSDRVGRASFTVTSDGREYTVGGEGSMLEDVEAMRVTITDVRR